MIGQILDFVRQLAMKIIGLGLVLHFCEFGPPYQFGFGAHFVWDQESGTYSINSLGLKHPVV